MSAPSPPASPQVTEEALHLLDEASQEHLDWLTRVHCSLLFNRGHGRNHGQDCGADPAPMAGSCPGAPAVEEGLAEKVANQLGESRAAFFRLKRAREHMEAMGRDLTLRAERGEHVDPDTYMAFMEAVQAYHGEGRSVELMLHQSLAETDPLTGLYNRRGMLRDLQREWVRAARTDSPCCVVLVDLDHFKQVNDEYGHPTGDLVLTATARFFQKRLRPYDSVYRYGGEEFLFSLPNTRSCQAKRVLDRLRLMLARLPMHSPEGHRFAITVSMGLAQMTGTEAVETTIARADQALYRAKNAGRNRVLLAEEDPLD